MLYNKLAYVTEQIGDVSDDGGSADGDAHLRMVVGPLECRGQANQCTVSEWPLVTAGETHIPEQRVNRQPISYTATHETYGMNI